MAFKSWKDVDETAYGRKLAEENKVVQAGIGRAADFLAPGKRMLTGAISSAERVLGDRADHMRANLGMPPREVGLPARKSQRGSGNDTATRRNSARAARTIQA